MSNINYHKITIPDDKPRSEYEYPERRAAILRLIEKRGHPDALNKAQLGREFGVSDAQIHKDLDRLKSYYANRVGGDAKVMSEMAYRKIIREHLDNGDLEKARRALDSWNNWLFDIGASEKTPDKLDVSLDPDEAYVESLKRRGDGGE